jgi:hypothetical protein
MLEELKDMLEKSIDESGLREEYEEFKKKMKPDFKIHIETHKKQEGYEIEVKGSRASLCLALAELTTNLMLETNLTRDDILDAVHNGIEIAEEEE